MAASKGLISSWFDEGKSQGYQYMIVVCDTFDHEDYPVYAKGATECYEKYDQHNFQNMQRVMEVYDLGQSKQDQLNEYRAFHLPGL